VIRSCLGNTEGNFVSMTIKRFYIPQRYAEHRRTPAYRNRRAMEDEQREYDTSVRMLGRLTKRWDDERNKIRNARVARLKAKGYNWAEDKDGNPTRIYYKRGNAGRGREVPIIHEQAGFTKANYASGRIPAVDPNTGRIYGWQYGRGRSKLVRWRTNFNRWWRSPYQRHGEVRTRVRKSLL